MGRPPFCEEVGIKKGPWTPEEDEKLMDYISKNGHGSWRTMSKKAGLNRCGKSCRLRWTNYLRSDIKRGKFTDEEERTIVNLHSILGNKWSKIAGHLPGRTDNEIKNFWNTHIRKKLLQIRIDPETHKPRNDLNHLMNLSHLLGISNLGNLMSPWTNPVNLQADVTQLAKIQMLQNLLQTINSNFPLGNMNNSTPFHNHNNLNPIEAFLNRTNNLQNKESFLISQEYANSGMFSQAHSNGFLDISKSWTDTEDGSKLYNPKVLDTSHGNQEDNKLPALVCVSPGTGSLDQMDRGRNITAPMCSSQSPSSTIFEAWEKFMDDETNNSYWKELLDLTSASESATSC